MYKPHTIKQSREPDTRLWAHRSTDFLAETRWLSSSSRWAAAASCARFSSKSCSDRLRKLGLRLWEVALWLSARIFFDDLGIAGFSLRTSNRRSKREH